MSAALNTTTGPTGDAVELMDDVLDRIVAGLTDGKASKPLVAAVTALRAGLLNADPAALPGLLIAVSNAVDRYGRTGLDEADLEVIRFALDYTSYVIGPGD